MSRCPGNDPAPLPFFSELQAVGSWAGGGGGGGGAADGVPPALVCTDPSSSVFILPFWSPCHALASVVLEVSGAEGLRPGSPGRGGQRV